MLIVGIDASTNKTGLAIFKDGVYISHILIDCHKIKDAFIRIPTMADDIWKYLESIDGIDKIIMEKSIFKLSIDTVQKLSNLSGAIMLYAFQNDIAFENPVPTEWRKKIGLRQSSKIKREVLKQEAIKAVSQEYGIEVSDDAAEAILIARSGFSLPKINVELDSVEEDWGEDLEH